MYVNSHVVHINQVADGESGAPNAAFALLLVLVVIAVMGGAVMSAQVIVQQRLRAAMRRNQIYQRRAAADATLGQILSAGYFLNPDLSNAVVQVPLPDQPAIAVAWQAAQPTPFMPSAALRIEATHLDQDGQVTGENIYTVWQTGNRWRLTRW